MPASWRIAGALEPAAAELAAALVAAPRTTAADLRAIIALSVVSAATEAGNETLRLSLFFLNGDWGLSKAASQSVWTACTCLPAYCHFSHSTFSPSISLPHLRFSSLPYITFATYNTNTMSAIPAITGKLRKRLILDLSVALGGGTALGYGYWYGVHVPANQRRDAFYLKYQQERGEA
ncbi:hypothetical protein A4X06_0g5326 [Tilletia controversa]|uniref:Cytochrome c oxidase polypeptide VIIA n=3 Tax=Tilletia TaxID=13289 RepID=A0A8X7MS84_9BASI|nr:hypothetical protein A4X06_0g5326 [Tilletia controversa]KAE8259201.1 hypothetical protein A4X03_0g4162 [Tilletia caries]